ncbi:hypothetical protein GQ55_8G227500 [Panicum hallii var. hallii]|uniref:Disease resistance R13L4/SHOC-2-like LRR domain-containing protein n=1 Tax=Panicum hallii var. hallii TaxID=1504633 RepID=A0A2T7CQ81_9POAL|nr:hypothetical protein GQ55_8G227500 [Panicum hallii var. hallii]PUZ45485.1 hypothetical protein GQ55_8G227500 [Panicum hallii var. hallii]
MHAAPERLNPSCASNNTHTVVSDPLYLPILHQHRQVRGHACMASKEEQGMGEADTVAPAAPERQHDVDSTVDERRKKKLIEEAIGSLGSGLARCSEMMEAARPGRGTGDLKLRCLDFLEKELRYIVAGLTALSPQHVDEEMTGWLQDLSFYASHRLPFVIDHAHLQRDNTLLRRASRFFRRRHRHPVQLLESAKDFSRLAEDPCRYRHLHGLPPHKYKIMYMIMFPYGHKFETDRLVMKWLCEGSFLLAGDPFSRLVSRNVITHAAPNSRRRTNRPDEAETWQWNVNPIQYQFLASKSAEMGFVFTSATLKLLAAGSSTGHGDEASRIPRRLALHHDDPNIPSLLREIDLSQTRSLAVSGAVSIGVPLDKFVNLVVLDVEGWVNFGDEDLLQVCRSKMFFLEYLSVRNTRVSKLPPEINELCRLRLLDASKTQVTEIPFGVFVATRFYRLDLRGTPIRQLTLPKQILRLQDSLHELLLGGEGMIYSAETATRLPHDIRRFSSLRTLATVDLSEQPASFVKALGDHLDWLEVLAITWSFHQSSDGDYCEVLLSSIKRWSQLRSLTIHCGLGCSMEFLGSLSDPPWHLEKFKVTLGRFVGVPQWFRGLRFLSFVQIIVCKQGARDLEILGYLPKLKCLILGLDFIPIEAIVIGNQRFRELQRFSIDCPVPWLTFESEAMPELTYLQLEFHACPTSPISVPSGITNLSSLTEVALWYNVRYANSSSVKMTVEAVREEVANRRNMTQMISLFINGIEQDDAQEVDKETESTTGAPSGPDAGAEGEAVVEKTTAVVDTEITEAES